MKKWSILLIVAFISAAAFSFSCSEKGILPTATQTPLPTPGVGTEGGSCDTGNTCTQGLTCNILTMKCETQDNRVTCREGETLIMGTCIVSACTTDSQCGTGFVCDPATKACKEVVVPSCKEGESLVDGKCIVTGCATDSQCGTGFACDQTTKSCKKSTTSITCKEGETLVDGACVPTTVTCKSGEELVDGICKALIPCTTSESCNIGMQCVEGYCHGTKNWTPIGKITFPEAFTSIVKVGNKIYIGTTIYGVFSSEDNGVSWTPLSSGLQGAMIYSLASVSNTLFAGTADGRIFKLLPGATTWNYYYSLGSNKPILSLLDVDDKLYAAIYGGGIVSFDSQGYPSNFDTDKTLYVQDLIKQDSSTLIVGTTYGMVKCSIPEKNCNDLNSGLPTEKAVTDVEMTANGIYAALYTGGVYKFVPETIQWTQMATLPNNPEVRSMISLSGQIYFSDLNKGVFKLDEATKTPSPVNSGLKTKSVSKLLKIDDTTMYVLAAGDAYKTSDGGANWSRIDNGMMFRTIESLAVLEGDLYAGVLDDLMLSQDGGKNWNFLMAGSFAGKVCVEPAGGALYALDDSSVRKSKSLGIFSKTGTAYPVLSCNRSMAAPQTSEPFKVELFRAPADDPPRILASNDDGMEWTAIQFSPPIKANFLYHDDNSRYAIAGNKIYVSTEGAGNSEIQLQFAPSSIISFDDKLFVSGTSTSGTGVVYQSEDKGISWSEAFHTDKSCSSTRVTSTENSLYFACNGTIIKSTDAGITWTQLGMPVGSDLGLNVINNIRSVDGAIFAGTRFGLYVYRK